MKMKNEEQWMQLQRRYQTAVPVIFSEYFLKEIKKRMYLSSTKHKKRPHDHKDEEEDCIEKKEAGNKVIGSNTIDVQNRETVVGAILHDSIHNE